jgi:hypothetical protein
MQSSVLCALTIYCAPVCCKRAKSKRGSQKNNGVDVWDRGRSCRKHVVPFIWIAMFCCSGKKKKGSMLLHKSNEEMGRAHGWKRRRKGCNYNPWLGSDLGLQLVGLGITVRSAKEQGLWSSMESMAMTEWRFSLSFSFWKHSPWSVVADETKDSRSCSLVFCSCSGSDCGTGSIEIGAGGRGSGVRTGHRFGTSVIRNRGNLSESWTLSSLAVPQHRTSISLPWIA